MDRKLPKRRGVSKKAVRAFLEDSAWQENAELSRLFAPDRVYQHPSGQTLVVFSWGRAVLYETREDLELMVQRFKELRSTPPSHILQDRLPYGEKFSEHVLELADRLAELLKLQPAELDRSLNSLQTVQVKIKRLGRKKCMEPPIFPSLVAYIGEAMRKEVNGQWEMRLSDLDHTTWEPWIVDPAGRICNSFIWLYNMLTEPGSLSISLGARKAMRSRHLPPTARPTDPSSLTTITFAKDRRP